VITIDPASDLPPYEQVRVQIARQVASGELVVGAKLPTVRRLATDLGLAPNTVARSYRELEAAGIIETRGRGGTVVAATGDHVRRRLAKGAKVYADLAKELGVARAEALKAVTAALDGTAT
jgi:DNA-binding transcriptional regulator YhcF (GntR family)